ncbi:MAG TPA: TonB-dependent receptor [Bacteroidales bacterium]|nr:TonB-dependent receptor [Bacteroidales bacterium]
MKKFFAASFLLFLAFLLHGQAVKHTISGFVREDVSGESLIGVNIYVPSFKTGTTTNTYGFYSLTIPQSGTIELVFSYVGYNSETFQVQADRDVEFNVSLKPGVVLGEVTVKGDRIEKQSESVKMSTVNLQPRQVKNVPSLLGEKDVLKVLQLMPGVQKGSEGNSGIYVRGGGPDQNLIILDDAIVYNASHLFGFFSLFNGDALKSVELTKGGFPARFGGRLSSVLEMNMKDGNREEWNGEGGIGLISSRLTVEGPIKKGKSSLLVSGRRTYADIVMKPFILKFSDENTGYYFYDLNAKVNYDLGQRDRLYLSGYFGKDKFYLKNKSQGVIENVGFLWGNSTGTLRWNHLFNNKLFANTSFIYSSYQFGIYDKYKVVTEEKDFYAEYYSGIRDLSLKYDLDFIHSTRHWFKAGGLMIFHRFKPHAFIEVDVPANINIRSFKVTEGVESGLYAEDTWQPVESFKVNAGLRFSHFIASKNQYHFLEPRLSAAWRFSNDLALKASYASMNQYIHMISGTGISLPTDLWVPTTDRIRPQQSRQVAMGLVKDLKSPEISVSLEGYYKTMQNVLGYREGASFLELDEAGSGLGVNWEDNVTAGKAWSYGAEFLIQKKTGRFTGWVGYTLSWTQMQFDSLNFGKKFWARYDRRHDISVVGTYRIKDRITISGTWVYGTGNAVTLPLSDYTALYHNPLRSEYGIPPGEELPFLFGDRVSDYSEKNNFRMRAYHRFDLGIQFHKQKRWGERTWEISFYNLYNRKNPFYYYTEEESVNGNELYGRLKQVSLFPIIPSVTYSFRF